MSHTPLISICIPVYNAESHLADAIESCLAQSYQNVEIICVNDGSTDSSLSILQSYSDKITVIDGDRKGAQAARNKAFSHSKGEFINFFDADNQLLPEKLTIQAEFLINGDADLVFGKRIIEKSSGEKQYPSSLPYVGDTDPFIYCLENNSPGTRAAIDTDVALHRRTFVEKINGFRKGVVRGQDKDFAFRMAAAGANFKYVDEYVTLYRDHDGPRISNIQKAADFNVNYFVSLAKALMSDSCYVLTPKATQALANKIIWSAKMAYRNNSVKSAEAGFYFVKQLTSLGDPSENNAYKLLRSILGYTNTEKLISKFRS